jgi:hypothetical protein
VAAAFHLRDGASTDTERAVPWTYTIDTAHDVLLARASGTFSSADLLAMRTVTTRDSRFHSGIRALFDYLDVSKSEVTFDAVAAWPTGQLYGPKSRRAILVNPGLHEAVAHAFRASIDESSHGKVFVTSSRAEAVAWLNDGVANDRRIE